MLHPTKISDPDPSSYPFILGGINTNLGYTHSLLKNTDSKSGFGIELQDDEEYFIGQSMDRGTHGVVCVKVKGNIHPITGYEGPDAEQVYSSTLSVTSALSWSGCRPGFFTPGKDPVPIV